MPPEPESSVASSGPFAAPAVPFGSNEVRLTPRQWAAAIAILALAFCCLPILWKRVEPLPSDPEQRVPFRLGYDYWTFSRYSDRACREEKTLVLGDSVVWGHYVSSRETLSHYLNQEAGEERFANLGVDGIHPAAMAGLVEYYGGDIAGKRVLLACNLLWMSSPRHDLQGEKEFAFNHPTLVPQFSPRIPCYRASLSTRLGIAIGREVPFFGWADHLRIAYLDNHDLARWTLEHPYETPAGAFAAGLPSDDESPSPPPDARPWTEQHLSKFNAAWVELDGSLQWRSLRRTVELLRRRGNRVFVLVGPFNEHMLTESSLAVYRQRLRGVEAWLQAEQVPYYIPPALPSETYADASHPLAEGYALLARQLSRQESFARFQSAREQPGNNPR